MKSGTESKAKFKNLKRRLQLRYWQVVGVLETLWRVTQIDAPAGDIGRLENHEIANALEWDGDPDALINALIDTHWIDRDDEFRLIIHDWSEHAPNHLVGAFKKNGRLFADELVRQRPKKVPSSVPSSVLGTMPSNLPSSVPSTLPSSLLGSVPPSQTKPSQTKPTNQTNHLAEDAGAGGLVVDGGEDLDHWGAIALARIATALHACGYARVPDLIRECRERLQTPREVLAACDEFQANRAKFKGPGAISERLRSGHWPVGGVTKNGHQKKPERDQLEAIRFRLVRDGVAEARDFTDEQLKKALNRNGSDARQDNQTRA